MPNRVQIGSKNETMSRYWWVSDHGTTVRSRRTVYELPWELHVYNKTLSTRLRIWPEKSILSCTLHRLRFTVSSGFSVCGYGRIHDCQFTSTHSWTCNRISCQTTCGRLESGSTGQLSLSLAGQSSKHTRWTPFERRCDLFDSDMEPFSSLGYRISGIQTGTYDSPGRIQSADRR